MLTYVVEFSEFDLSLEEFQGYEMAILEGCGFLDTPGQPMLPTREIAIALPAGLTVTGVELLDDRQMELAGSHSIYPAQPPRATSEIEGVPFTGPEASIYGSSELYPASPVQLLQQADLAGQNLAYLRVSPVRYRPAQGQLSLMTSMTLGVRTAPGGTCGDYLPAGADARTRAELLERLRSLVINPEDISLEGAPLPQLSRALEPGQYELVIITDPYFEAAFAPLVEWKTKKGVPTKLVTTAWIYYDGGYAGPEHVDEVRQFIVDAYNTWGATYFLIGGNLNKVPVHWWTTPAGMDPPIMPEDVYYADFDDDWVLEVTVGRWPVGYSSQVAGMVEKVLTYERTPPATGYAARMGLWGFDLDEDTPGEACKEFIDSQYVPASLEVSKVYDSHEGNHAEAGIAAVNGGLHLVNHIDHCNSTGLGMGSVNHGWEITPADEHALTNGDYQIILYSVGCYVGAFDRTVCISTEFVNDADGGALAFVCNTRNGLYNAGACNTLSHLYDRYFWRELFTYGKHRLGQCFTDHKGRLVPSTNSLKYVFKELSLFGDPDLPVWTADPAALAVTHEARITAGTTAFNVHVADGGGTPQSGARVCLWKGGELYLVEATDAGGDVSFDPSAADTGMAEVTVTLHNFLPYEGEVEIISEADVADDENTPGTFRLDPARPSPFRARTSIAYALPAAGPVSLRVHDLAGRVVRILTDGPQAAGVHRVVWDGRDDQGRSLASGVYLYRLRSPMGEETRQILLVH